MRYLTKKHLSRRTLLRGAGVAMALPLLESMIPAAARRAWAAGEPPARVAFIYIPHGAVMDRWTAGRRRRRFRARRRLCSRSSRCASG